eukprot:g1018.t1
MTNPTLFVCSVIVLILLPTTILSCAPEGVTTISKVGDKTYVCLVINSKRVSLFMPQADQYTRINLQDSFNSTNFDTETLTSPTTGECTFATRFNSAEPKACKYTVIHVESMGKRSLAKAYKVYHHDENTPKWAFPILTIVISVKKGKVQALTWDDGCHFCQDVGDSCQSNIFTLPTNRFNETIKVSDTAISKLMLDGLGKNCRVDANPGVDILTKARDCTGTECQQYNKYCVDGNCDLKLFVVWTGTDSEGNYFKSASLRFSRFAKYSINDLYSSAKQNTLEVATEVKNTAETATRL